MISPQKKFSSIRATKKLETTMSDAVDTVNAAIVQLNITKEERNTLRAFSLINPEKRVEADLVLSLCKDQNEYLSNSILC